MENEKDAKRAEQISQILENEKNFYERICQLCTKDKIVEETPNVRTYRLENGVFVERSRNGGMTIRTGERIAKDYGFGIDKNSPSQDNKGACIKTFLRDGNKRVFTYEYTGETPDGYAERLELGTVWSEGDERRDLRLQSPQGDGLIGRNGYIHPHYPSHLGSDLGDAKTMKELIGNYLSREGDNSSRARAQIQAEFDQIFELVREVEQTVEEQPIIVEEVSKQPEQTIETDLTAEIPQQQPENDMSQIKEAYEQVMEILNKYPKEIRRAVMEEVNGLISEKTAITPNQVAKNALGNGSVTIDDTRAAEEIEHENDRTNDNIIE